jgi:Zn finger protein HypA/HybF involved in hydrogenase expression
MPARCARCGLQTVVELAADGQPTTFEAAFSAPRLLAWFAAARVAMAQGIPGVAVGACAACQAPLVVSSRDPIALPCPHCKEPVTGPTAEVLVDQWPEPWCKVEGGGIELEYRLAIVEDSTGLSAGCPACGLAVRADDPSMKCKRCGAVVWVSRGDERRVQLGVRVNGTRQNLPFNALVPIVQGEMMLRADAAAGGSSQSGRSFLGLTGLGCAIAVALLALMIGAAIVVAKTAHC